MKKIISFIVCLTFLFATFAQSAVAFDDFSDAVGDDSDNSKLESTTTNNKTIKKSNTTLTGSTTITNNAIKTIVTTKSSIINKTSYQDALNQLSNQLGNVEDAKQVLDSIGINDYDNFIHAIDGVENINSVISNIGGTVSEFSSIASNLNELGQGAISQLINTVGADRVTNLISQFGNINQFTSIIGQFGNINQFTSFIQGLGSVGNFQNLLSQLGGLSGFSNILGQLGGFSNFTGLLGSIGGIGNLSGLLGSIGGIGNLSGLLGSIGGIGNLSGLLGSIGGIGNLSGFLGIIGGLGNLSNILGQLGNFASLTSALQNLSNMFNFSNLLDFFNWLRTYFQSFGISIGNISGACSGSKNSSQCAAVKGIQNAWCKASGTCSTNSNSNSTVCSGGSCSIKKGDFSQEENNFLSKKKLNSKITNNKANEIINKASTRGKQEALYKEIIAEVKKYSDVGNNNSATSLKGFQGNNSQKKLPFSKGNDGTIKSASNIMDEENTYIQDEETGMCNKKLGTKTPAKMLKALTAPAIPSVAAGQCPMMATEDHSLGIFTHSAFGASGGCREIHKVKPNPFIKAVGECRMLTVGVTAPPTRFRGPLPPFGNCCATWTVISDKVEYYFPTEKITLSEQPLYSRFLDGEKVKDMFTAYQTAVKKELNSQEASKESAKYLSSKLKEDSTSTQTSTKSLTDTNLSNSKREIQPSSVVDTAFLHQIRRGFARYFKLDDVEKKYSLARWNNLITPVLPHISAEKSYWGTDFEDKNDKFFGESDDKENLAFFITPAKKYSSTTLQKKDEEHLKNSWNTLKRDGQVGGSKQYGTQMKADPTLHGRGTLSDGKTRNTYRQNKNAYGVGNISSLHSITPTGNSDNILQTLLRTQNMFLEEVDPLLGSKPFEEEDKNITAMMQSALNPSSAQSATASCIYQPGVDDPQLKRQFAQVITNNMAPYFYLTLANPFQGKRQSYKSMYDVFHCPVVKSDDGKKYPQLFNEFFNKDIQNIKENEAKSETINTVKGEECFTMAELLNNNLDFNLMNTISTENKNIKTVGNKGEISFTAYTLFTGAIGFPGQACPFWYRGENLVLSPGARFVSGFCRAKNGGSKATPKFKADEFRLF